MLIGNGVTIGVFLRVPGIVLQHRAIDDIAQLGIHLDRYLVADPNKEVHEEGPLPITNVQTTSD